ncbi:MAG: cysteine desulfurase [Alphaproteobacteria bacterium]|nr:cysteine desulfurase [Alphaproteobacteria bacterium]
MTAMPTDAPSPLDVEAIRADFPCLHQQVHGKPLVYLDNAASSQTPQAVLDALTHYYTHDRANVHRGVHELSQRASAAYDGARSRIQAFLNAEREEECVYVRGTTEAINLVAQSWGPANVGPGDEIVITQLEHHANIVPWQLLCQRTGATLRHIPIDAAGALRMDVAAEVIGPRCKLVAVAHVSNALGTINPVAEIVRLAHAQGALVLVDGAQATPHLPVDVQALGCDFYAFSGHKVCGPTGIGALWGRHHLLEAMPPWQGGGDMISEVRLDVSTYQPPPLRFEAGTHHIAGVIGLGAALDYLMDLGMDRIAAYEHDLFTYATARLATVERIRPVGTAAHKAGVFSFLVDGAHPTDVGTLLDSQGIAVRTGHHCAQPVMTFYGVSATARASFAFYNTRDEVDRFVEALHKVLSWL